MGVGGGEERGERRGRGDEGNAGRGNEPYSPYFPFRVSGGLRQFLVLPGRVLDGDALTPLASRA